MFFSCYSLSFSFFKLDTVVNKYTNLPTNYLRTNAYAICRSSTARTGKIEGKTSGASAVLVSGREIIRTGNNHIMTNVVLSRDGHFCCRFFLPVL